MSKNIYYNPEDHGLTIVASVDAGGDYDYDTLLVFEDADGNLYWADDAGCSCPVPFEDYEGVGDLNPITPKTRDGLHRWATEHFRHEQADVIAMMRVVDEKLGDK